MQDKLKYTDSHNILVGLNPFYIVYRDIIRIDDRNYFRKVISRSISIPYKEIPDGNAKIPTHSMKSLILLWYLFYVRIYSIIVIQAEIRVV